MNNGKNLMRKCYVCGKEFLPTVEYVYKIVNNRHGTVWCCSYSCMNKAKHMLDEENREKRKQANQKRSKANKKVKESD